VTKKSIKKLRKQDELDAITLQRIAAHSEKHSNGCVHWTGSHIKGRGIFNVSGKRYLVTRYIMEKAIGFRLAEFQHVCHTCDNPRCINIDHLFVAEAHINYKDCSNKKRNWAQQKENGKKVAAVMANARKTMLAETDFYKVQKITKEMVLEMDKMKAQGMSWTAIGKKFNVHRTTVERWVNRKPYLSQRYFSEPARSVIAEIGDEK
jgi:hypothetical protein